MSPTKPRVGRKNKMEYPPTRIVSPRDATRDPILTRFRTQHDRDWEKTTVIVVHGGPETGKTSWAFSTYPGAYFAPPITRGGTLYMDGYFNQEVVIFDEYSGGMRHDQFLRVLDRYPLTCEVKGGYVKFIPKTIVITTDIPPTEWYPDRDYEPLKRRITDAYTMIRVYSGGPRRSVFKLHPVPEWCEAEIIDD